jgi:hypothetical protein
VVPAEGQEKESVVREKGGRVASPSKEAMQIVEVKGPKAGMIKGRVSQWIPQGN